MLRPAGSTWSSTSRCRPTSSSSAWPAGGCASTAARTTRVDDAARARLDLRRLRRRGRPARGRHRGRHQPAARSSTRTQTEPLIAWYLERDKLVASTASAPPTQVTARLVQAIDRTPRTPCVGTVREAASVDADELAKMRRAGRVVAEMHERCIRGGHPPGCHHRGARPGRPGRCSTRRGARSNFLNYHGVPGGDLHLAQRRDRARHPRRLRARGGRHPLDRLRGDHRGLPRRRRLHHPASARSATRPQKLIEVTEQQPLRPASSRCVDGNRLSDIGHAVQTVAEGAGFSVVREYVGHGIGTAMHEEPQVPNYGPPGKGIKLKAGPRLRGRAHGQRRAAPTRAARRRLDAS